MFDYSQFCFFIIDDHGISIRGFLARFYDHHLSRWVVSDSTEQFSNPYLAMANNPVRYTDPNGMYTSEFDWDDGGDSGGSGWNSQLNWGANHDSYLPSNSNWLNEYGAHNRSFAPYSQNGHIYHYNPQRGGFGYEKEYVDVFGTAIQWAYFPNNPEAKVLYKPLFGVVNEWVSFGNGTTTISGISPDFSLGVSVGTTEVGLAADLTIKEMAKRAPQALKVISKMSNGGGGVIGAVDNGIQTFNDYQNGNYGRATINATQGAAYLTGTILLFTPLAPIGGAIILVTTISDWVQTGVEYGTGIENY